MKQHATPLLGTTEIVAFNLGVLAVLDRARAAAAALEGRPDYKMTRHGFAVVALTELAEGGRQLLIPIAPAGTTGENQDQNHG